MSDDQGRPRVEAELDPREPLDASLGPGRYAALYDGAAAPRAARPAPGAGDDPPCAGGAPAARPRVRPARGGRRGLPRRDHARAGAGRASERWPLSFSVIRQVLDRGLAVLASDTRIDPQFEDAESIQRFRIRSVLCVPLGRPGARRRSTSTTAASGRSPPTTCEFVTALARLRRPAAGARGGAARHTQALLGERASAWTCSRASCCATRSWAPSPPLLQAYDALRRFARGGARVLLRGESGHGQGAVRARLRRGERPARAAYIPVPIPALAPGSWSRSCSATCAARSPRPRATRRGGSRWRTAACCSSTRSATSSPRCR